jgi:hypothetical protein
MTEKIKAILPKYPKALEIITWYLHCIMDKKVFVIEDGHEIIIRRKTLSWGGSMDRKQYLLIMN